MSRNATLKLWTASLLALTGCASLQPHEHANRVLLTSESLPSLNGLYQYVGVNIGCEGCAPRLFEYRVLGGRSHRTSGRPARSDSAVTLVSLRVTDPSHIVATSYVGGVVHEERRISGRVNEGGYFEIARGLNIRGQFPIWNIGNQKAQLGLASDGSLLVDEAVAGIGILVLLPIMAADGASNYVFERVGG